MWKGGGGATICLNKLQPSKVANAWCNFLFVLYVPLLDCSILLKSRHGELINGTIPMHNHELI